MATKKPNEPRYMADTYKQVAQTVDEPMVRLGRVIKERIALLQRQRR